MRTSPRPTQDTIHLYYPPEYAPHRLAQPVERPLRSASESRWKKRVRQFLRHNSWELPALKPGRLLEIGCGSGAFLHHMASEGWEVSGLEFSEQVAARVRSQGFHITSGALETAAPSPAGFDLVVGWMVVEHLHDPITALERVRAWGKPGAWLVISVPDAGSLEFRIFKDAWYGLQLPFHLYHFSANTIGRVLAEAGWKVERVFWHNNPNNLLQSLRYRCIDNRWTQTAALLLDVAEGRRLRRSHMLLGKLLQVLCASGRMTVWARSEGPA